MKAANRVLKRFGINVRRIAGNIVKLGVAMATAIPAASLVMVKAALTSVDALAKISDKLGVTTENLSGLQHAAQLSGVEIRTFNMGLQRLTRRVSEAAIGTGEAQAAIKELGLDAAKLNKAGPTGGLLSIADAFAKIESQADRVRLAFKLFDSEGVALVNIVQRGASALREMMGEAQAFGLVFSRNFAAKVERANNEMLRLRGLFRGVFVQLAGRFADRIAMAARAFIDLELETRVFGKTFEVVFKTAAVVAGGFAIVIAAIGEVISSMVTVVRKSMAAILRSVVSTLDKIKVGLEFLPFGLGTNVAGLDKLLDKLELVAAVLETGAAAGSDFAESLAKLRKVLLDVLAGTGKLGNLQRPQLRRSGGGSLGGAGAGGFRARTSSGSQIFHPLRDVIPQGDGATGKQQNVFDRVAREQRRQMIRTLRELVRGTRRGMVLP